MPVDGTIQLAYQDTAWFNDPLNAEIILKEGQHVYLSDGTDEFLSAYVVGDGVTELQDLPWKGLIYPTGVQSVTGVNVDNIDPTNPVVNEQQVMFSPDTNSYMSVTNNDLSFLIGSDGTNFSSIGVSSLGVQLDDNGLAGSKPLMLDANKRIKGLTSAIWGTFINTLSSKTTPVNADSIEISDSAASNTAKKVSLTNFKSFLKTYFDTLYTTTSAVASQITTALSGYYQGKITNTLQCQFTATTFADSTTYYFATIPLNAATVSATARRFRMPFTGLITKVYFNSASGTATSSQDIELRIKNVTSGTTTVVGNVRFDNITNNISFTGLTIAGSENDEFECILVVQVLTTNGVGSNCSLQLYLERN